MEDVRAQYRLVDRRFSRVWRRNKTYDYNGVKWLARRHGYHVKRHGADLLVLDKLNNNVATLREVSQSQGHEIRHVAVVPIGR